MGLPRRFKGACVSLRHGLTTQVHEEMTVKKHEYGRAIGSHLGKPIYEFFKDENATYIFDRLAQCDTEGCPLDQVKKGELLFQPGLIYKKAS